MLLRFCFEKSRVSDNIDSIVIKSNDGSYIGLGFIFTSIIFHPYCFAEQLCKIITQFYVLYNIIYLFRFRQEINVIHLTRIFVINTITFTAIKQCARINRGLTAGIPHKLQITPKK